MAASENFEEGLSQRYAVQHLGDSEKHRDCEYFVLDLTHDAIARRTAQVYALIAEENGHAKLASDLRSKIDQIEAFYKAEEELKTLKLRRDNDFFNE